jgi:hypothetical protein
MKTEIAGLTISYATAPELTEKLTKAFGDVKDRLKKIEEERRTLRIQKKQIEKFLGLKKKNNNISPITTSSKE